MKPRLIPLMKISKVEARALLAAFDWCECSFTLGKSQENIRQRIYTLYPDLKEVEEQE